MAPEFVSGGQPRNVLQSPRVTSLCHHRSLLDQVLLLGCRRAYRNLSLADLITLLSEEILEQGKEE
jgi:hypothetical protein